MATLVAVCNDYTCPNRDRPCRTGCIQDSRADYCSGCQFLVCPFECIDYVRVLVVFCKKGRE
jgi:hypothetical protein